MGLVVPASSLDSRNGLYRDQSWSKYLHQFVAHAILCFNYLTSVIRPKGTSVRPRNYENRSFISLLLSRENNTFLPNFANCLCFCIAVLKVASS